MRGGLKLRGRGGELAEHPEQDAPRTRPGGLPAELSILSDPLLFAIVPLPPNALGVSAARKVTVLPPVTVRTVTEAPL